MARIYRRPDKPGGTYYVDYLDNTTGERVRKSLETCKLKDAKDRLEKIIRGEVNTRWGATPHDISTATFWPDYEKWARANKGQRSVDQECIDWNHFITALRPQTLGTVTAQHVERFKSYLRDVRKMENITINNTCIRMRAIYNHAARLGYYKGANPFTRFKQMPVDQDEATEFRFLSLEQMEALLTAAKEHSQDIYLFCSLCLFAGLRSGEASNLRWEHVDFEKGTITVIGARERGFRTKSGKKRTVPLATRLGSILAEYHEPDAQGYILLPGKAEKGVWRVRYEPKKAFDAIRKTAKVTWCSPHTLRHTFASQHVMAGTPLFVVSRWLGHRRIETTEIYAHLAPGRDERIDAF